MQYWYKGMKIGLAKDVYEPLEDSELLAEALEQDMKSGLVVLDMGCGCGLLGMIAARAGCDVTAVDANPEAIRLASLNAKLNDVKIECLVSNLFEKINARFDIIVFNPPYLPDKDDVKGSEIWSNRNVIEDFIEKAAGHLRPNGRILLLVSSLTPTSDVIDRLARAGFNAEIVAQRKVPWEVLSVIRAELQSDNL